MPISFDSALGIHAEALRVRSARAEMLAANLANADTPNYKARDIDFRAALQAAQASSASNALTPSQAHPKHLPLSGTAQSFDAAVRFRASAQDALDGNSVDAQIEQAQFMQNAIQYQASLELLGSRFQSLTKAIKGE